LKDNQTKTVSNMKQAGRQANLCKNICFWTTYIVYHMNYSSSVHECGNVKIVDFWKVIFIHMFPFRVLFLWILSSIRNSVDILC
jgi:hypothetical protein